MKSVRPKTMRPLRYEHHISFGVDAASPELGLEFSWKGMVAFET
jgi:hypothetical protein